MNGHNKLNNDLLSLRKTNTENSEIQNKLYAWYV